MLKVELNPDPPKLRITKQLLYFLCYGSLIDIKNFRALGVAAFICWFRFAFRKRRNQMSQFKNNNEHINLCLSASSYPIC